jgi:hypothetical protein
MEPWKLVYGEFAAPLPVPHSCDLRRESILKQLETKGSYLCARTDALSVVAMRGMHTCTSQL